MLLQFSPKGEFPIAEPPEGVVLRQVEVSDLAGVVAPRLVKRRGSAVSISFLKKSFLEACFLAVGESTDVPVGLCLVELQADRPCIVYLEGESEKIALCLLSKSLRMFRDPNEMIIASDWQAFDLLKHFGFQALEQETQDAETAFLKLEVAELLLESGQEDKAKPYLESALSALDEPKGWKAKYGVMRVLLNQGRLEEATALASDLPERILFRQNYTKGAQFLAWSEPGRCRKLDRVVGQVMPLAELTQLTPLLFRIFGDDRNWISSFRKSANPDCCVALKLHDEWVGCCLVGGEIPAIWSIGVLPQWRGRGYSRGLLSHSLKLLTDTNHKTVKARIHPNNNPSLALFRKADFHFVNSTADFMKMATASGRVYRSDFRSLNLNPDEVEEACREGGIEILD